jgi:hypothetical protein
MAAQGFARDFFTIAFFLLANCGKHKMFEAYGLRDRRPPEKMQ